MPRKSETLKMAVSAPAEKEVVGEVVDRVPAKRGPKPKEAPAVDLKAVKRDLTAKQKEANTTEKAFLAQVKAINDQVAKDTKALNGVGDLDKELSAVAKEMAKLKDRKEKLESAIDKALAKQDIAAGKLRKKADAEIDKLRTAKGKVDDKLAKEIAALEKVLDSATE